MRNSRTAMTAVTGAGLLALASLLAFAPAAANDSSASLDVGGLKLTYNPNVSVESEDLYLSRDEVRVTYHFRNRSDHDISTLVAFPLPTMEIGEEGNYIFAGNDPVNVMDFQVTVDGKKVEPSVEVRATRFGVDVTDVLKRYNIPLTMAGGDEASTAAYDRLNALPEDARRELERYGVIDWETATGAENKRHHPLGDAHRLLLVSDLSRRAQHRGDPPLSSRAAAFLLRQGGPRLAGDAQDLLLRCRLRSVGTSQARAVLARHSQGL